MPAEPGTVLEISAPDDWHVHLRDGEALSAVAPFTARQFRRAIVMPNLRPPIQTVGEAEAYRKRILEACGDAAFAPLMTLYLTETTEPEEVDRAAASEFVAGIKLYPAGATTNSEAGVHSLSGLYRVFERMEERDLVLEVHGEVTDRQADVFDRERLFLERELAPLVERFQRLRVVFEHVTTREAVDFVRETKGRVGATITPQHLLLNRNALFAGGIRPHNYCLPVLKREEHRRALVDAATSGHSRFFLGTDSAPHSRSSKETACGCAGVFSAPLALELYAEVFDNEDRLDQFEAFASTNGPAFYGLPKNTDRVRLCKQPRAVPTEYDFGSETIVPFRAGEQVSWVLLA
ncbi:MAG: dihydroorotase [Spirochaetales bacterium]|nr:dihydroorotase [Leptospiraceae bacterium]MCP5479878.1 dihydroorotase [Spirochaetales bacterium]MCP5486268.1 dihydroorotase [Spirochaetales bacterium]